MLITGWRGEGWGLLQFRSAFHVRAPANAGASVGRAPPHEILAFAGTQGLERE